MTWRDGLPDDLKADPNLEPIKGETWDEAGPVLVKSFINAQKMIGGRIPLPAKPEEVDAWKKENLPKLEKAGISFGTKPPETPDKYTLPQGKAEVFENVKMMDMIKTKILPDFHKLNLDSAQAEGVMGTIADIIENVENTRTVSHNQAVESLRKEWGVEYDAKVSRAIRAVNAMGGEGLQQHLDETGWGDDPVLVKVFSRMGEFIGEDGFVKGGQVTMDSSKEQAKAKIAEISNNMDHPLWHDNKPGHPEAVQEWTRLHQVAFGTGR